MKERYIKEKIHVGISNHHVHLTEEVYNQLFDHPLTKKNDLHQLNEFASDQVVTIRAHEKEIANLRIVGPLRSYNQVEITRSDAIFLGLNPPVRRSGQLENSETITLIGPCGQVVLKNSCIIAERHVHMNSLEAMRLGVKDKDQVQIRVSGEKASILFANVKVSDNGFYEVHLDFDDANALGLKNGDEVEVYYHQADGDFL